MISVYDLLYYRTQYGPENLALVYKNVSITYKHLGERICQLAYGLRQIGIKKGTPVGYLFYNCPTCIELFYALQKIGAIAIPFNYRYGTNEIEPLIKTVQCAYFIYESRLKKVVQEIRQGIDLNIIFIEEGNETSEGTINLASLYENKGEDQKNSCPASDNDITLMLFTGGTTGIPKAVMMSGEDVYLRTTLVYLDDNGFSRDAVMLLNSPLFHVGGIMMFLYMISVGATIVLQDSFNIDLILHTIEKRKITHMVLIPPSICRRIKESPLYGKVNLSSVRFIFMSGGNNSSKLINEVFEMFPSAFLFSALGHTEGAEETMVMFNKKEMMVKPNIANSVGRLTKGSFIELRDESGNRIGKNCPGEAWAKSPFMMAGFWGKESPFVNGWYATGDILKQDEEGYFYFLDRKKDMIKSGGENVYAVEVENVLSTHPAIMDCAVFALPDNELSEIVAAAVVLNKGSSISTDEIILYCKERMASYKKPKEIFFLDKLPRTSLGKVNKNALRQLSTLS